ncbi:MAG: methyl-accepting chemotaxis protein [Roseobacter sp.]
MVRLALIFSALALMTAAAITISWFVFQSIAANMQTLTEERIPGLTKDAQMVAVADSVRGVLSDLLIADAPQKLESLAFKKQLILEDLSNSASSYSGDVSAELDELVAQVDSGLSQLVAARQDEFSSIARLAEEVENATIVAQEVSAVLADNAAGAYIDLIFGSEETIAFVDTTLTSLIEEDFAAFQLALAVRADLNLMMGAALSLTQTSDSAIAAILTDLGIAARERLAVSQTQLAENEATAELAVLLENAKASVAQLFDGVRFGVSPQLILSTRQEFDALLSTVLDDIYFDLTISSEDAKTSNSEAITALVDNQVGRMQAQYDLLKTVNGLFEIIMSTALAQSPEELAARDVELKASASTVRTASLNSTEEVQALIGRILVFADGDKAINTVRAATFAAEQKATVSTRDAAESVRLIAVRVGEMARDAQSQIAANADVLTMEVARARTQIQTIGALSLAIVALAPFLIWFSVTRPLNRLTSVTEQLADGDLSEINGLDKQRGEIGRMADALKIFRSGALERIEMQEAEKKREAELREAELAAERAKQAAHLREQKAEEERAQEQREAEQAERDREEKQRAAVEAVEKQRAAEQALVVTELANSLKSLSEGDLTRTISTEFPGDYEQLRQDYNSAISNLAHLIQQIGKSAGLIDSGSAEIAASSLDLSRRTENAAATLEETAAALSELTASVSSAARGASEATETVDAVKHDAEDSQKVMTEAVHAMDQIDTSSSEIAKIVEVIDSIAFQTNLLALNAGVEAARAGDAGRGFAVVASEVRILAHRCSDAAEQINKLISESSTHVQEGVSLIDQANEALATILCGIRNMSKNVSEIAVSAQEQSTGISEINVAVEQLDRSTQQNAAMFEETTAASQSLTSEAGQLSNLVAGFHVDQRNSDATPHSEPPSIAKSA